MKPVLTLVVVRHGETTANRDRVLQGQSKVPYALTELGQAQAQQAGRALHSRHVQCQGWWRVFSSDLHRAEQTASIILDAVATDEEQALPSLETSPMIREYAAGYREDLPMGTTPLEAAAIRRERGWPDGTPEESTHIVFTRAAKFVESLLADAQAAEAERGKNLDREVVLVSHGGFIRILFNKVFGIPVESVNNTSVSVLHIHTAPPPFTSSTSTTRPPVIEFSVTKGTALWVEVETTNDTTHLNAASQSASKW